MKRIVGVLLLLSATVALAQSYTFNVVAGVAPQIGSADGSGAQARFFYPQGIAVDGAGNRYVADTDNHLIRKISATGVVTTVAGAAGVAGTVDGPGKSARFDHPRAIASDPLGTLFVAGQDQTIRKITPAGIVSTLAGSPGKVGHADGTGSAASFGTVMGLAVDLSGNVFATDWDNFLIRKITPTGVVTTYAGIANYYGTIDGPVAKATFAYPTAIACDALGNLYVSTISGSVEYSEVIRKITSAGVVSTLPGSNCGIRAGIRGIACEPTGYLDIAVSNYSVHRLTPFGVNTVLAGIEWNAGCQDGTGAAARFSNPMGISIDPSGDLYVPDGPAIRRITPAGVVSTIAGQPGTEGSTDGNGSAASFNSPGAMTGDSQGNVFVADVMNCTIRKITPAGDVSTFVGSPSTPGDNTAAPPTATRDTWTGPTLAIDSSGNLFGVTHPSHILDEIFPTKVITTVGISSAMGAVDGPSPVARFSSQLSGVVTGGAGTLFVTDGNAIRKVAPDGSMSTIAGNSAAGSVDGPGLSARFRTPSGIAVDRAGNLYVADTYNNTIRKIAPDGTVSTLAGSPLASGSADGVGAQARFNTPWGLAVDSAGNVFVADRENACIRKVSPAGVVTTLSGVWRSDYYFSDGTGARARFLLPSGIWVSPQGDLYVTDETANVVVKGVLDRVPTITVPPQSSNVVTGAPAMLTVAATGGGLSYQWKFNGTPIAGATNATYAIPAVTTDSGGSYSVEIGNSAGSITSPAATLTVVVPTMPVINAAPASTSAFVGTDASFSVTATGGGLAYQWKFNGVPIAGATNANYTAPRVSPADAGTYTVDISNPIGTVSSTGAALAVTTPGRLTNLSILTTLASAGDNFTLGMTIGGAGVAGPKPVLVRAMGPSLTGFGIQNPVPDPRLAAYNGAVLTDRNAGWSADSRIAVVSTAVGAFPFASPGSADSAVYLADATGSGRTFNISGTGAGVVLAEIYDATPVATYTLATPRLANLSVLRSLNGGVTAGFVVGGNTKLMILIRAIGPSLVGFGVSGTATQTKLELFDGSGSTLAANAGWGGAAAMSAAFRVTGAFPLDPASADAVLLLNLAPGSYTAKATAADGTGGMALLEIYEVP